MTFLARILRKKGSASGGESGHHPQGGYYSLYDDGETEPYEAHAAEVARAPSYDDWDARLDRLDTHFKREDERRKTRWWQPSHWRERRKRWWAVRIIAAVLLLFIALIGWLAFTAPLNKSLEPIAPPQITLLAANGTPIARNGAITDEPVVIDELPPHVVEAFLSIEDRRFYSHWGVDPRGLGRAVWARVSGGPMQGGSTITQQLAKFTFLTPDQTLSRKAREMLIAFWLESWLTKDEILARYLSNAYFGDNVYGIRAASLHFFYRKPENLTRSQAAMLAGLVQAPSRFNPVKHYERAERRMKMVVNAMVAAGYITEAEAAGIRSPALDVRLKSDLPTGTYFADWALPQARERSEGGYARQTLTTTLDARLQTLARRVTAGAKLGGAQVALVAMRPNGEVVAMVGGKDYRASPFNRATQAQRQSGSTIKTFVYLAALRDGWSPQSTIANTEITQGSYRPRNANGRYSDEITLRDALAQSSNVATVRLFNAVGSEKVIATARDYGIGDDLPKGDPSIALGSTSMSLIELTSAYAGLAGNAFPIEASAFAQEERSWWDELWDGPDSLSESTHGEMEDMLRHAINGGTGRAAMLAGPNFGKTGTSQNNRDALFVGYAEGLVVGVWIGNDDNSPLDGITGGGLPARIWRDFMRQAVVSKPDPARTTEQQDDPGGPIEPLDVPELEDIPIGDDSRLRIRDGEVILSTEIEGVPLEIVLGEEGVEIDAEEIERALEQASER
ncbi:transglycosylase domain-containing protein [Erythrobacter sp. W53]|uniref:transglycosylase domain-containing protein n=1 Tax=Erythrobacter sp. W53 TaxID=3425947 RepID=UPI003D7682E4